tara:strand:+ start:1793 stop:3025 length:1233 start_codon:yes stop_codon:yes gene_type:complete
MANTINNIKDGPGLFAKGMAQTLKDNMKFCAFVDKADESDFDGKNGFKSGDTINTSIPARYVPQQDDLDITSTIQDTVEEKAPLVLDKTETIGMKLNSLELATDVDVANALKRFGIPAAESIAQNMEARCFQIATDATYNFTGTPGSGSFTVADILAAKTKLNKNLCPLKDRMLFMNSDSGAIAVNDRKGLFQSSEQIKKQYEDGYIGRSDGFDWVETELISNHTNGNQGGTPLTNGVGVEGASSIALDGVTSGNVWTKGTVFTIAGVYRVHPITKQVTPDLQEYVVTADATFTGGAATVAISPALYAGSNGLQNIDALPADGAATVLKTGAASTAYAQNLALHKNAFKMVTAPLYAPSGVDLVATETVDGITVNLVRDFDVKTREVITRVDVLYGFDKVRPEWSTRLTA